MTTLVTVAILREHVETDLADAALQRLIDDADAAVVQRFGPHADVSTPVTELLTGGDRYLFPSRLVGSVQSVTETVGTTDTTLATNDWRLWQDGRAVERLNTGTNVRWAWGNRVALVYSPLTDNPQRTRVILDLVRLALAFTGLQTERAGDYNSTALNYDEERAKLLRTLTPRGGLLLR